MRFGASKNRQHVHRYHDGRREASADSRRVDGTLSASNELAAEAADGRVHPHGQSASAAAAVASVDILMATAELLSFPDMLMELLLP